MALSRALKDYAGLRVSSGKVGSKTLLDSGSTPGQAAKGKPTKQYKTQTVKAGSKPNFIQGKNQTPSGNLKLII
jgi:hypothetical protein